MNESMRAFNDYNVSLTKLYHEIVLGKLHVQTELQVTADMVADELRRIIPIDRLRKAGSFFTGDVLAGRATGSVSDHGLILDPACGAGSLLTAFTKKLTVKTTLADTLREWGRVLYGCDLFPEFVEATKLRIILEAISRGVQLNGDSLDELKDLLYGIKQGDGLRSVPPEKCTHVLMNPPFRSVPAPANCQWAGGKLNEAALFVEYYLQRIPENCTLIAILPEVLRCGTRYEKWRAWLEENFTAEVTLSGQFDTKTDVDVFLLAASRLSTQKSGENQINWRTQTDEPTVLTVGSLFDVRVGSVVPYRDEIAGKEYPFACPSNLPRWGIVSEFKDRCGYVGRKINPPFVAIRRTSSPSDRERAAATIVIGKEAVAVENHLIAASPRKGGLRACKRLLKLLRSAETNRFLNRRMRCRHLTVGAVKEINIQEKIHAQTD
ncbi:MAG: SAM-dependent DNA methyltransferase [Candidatus Aegiribacteria sp.]|nr:SAM-dependent DNA methyltransferase [Candidatus Aegiribacteria sp.]